MAAAKKVTGGTKSQRAILATLETEGMTKAEFSRQLEQRGIEIPPSHLNKYLSPKAVQRAKGSLHGTSGSLPEAMVKMLDALGLEVVVRHKQSGAEW